MEVNHRTNSQVQQYDSVVVSDNFRPGQVSDPPKGSVSCRPTLLLARWFGRKVLMNRSCRDWRGKSHRLVQDAA